MTQLLLVRHGSTQASGRMLAGWMNGVRLNDAGRAQVRALGERLVGRKVRALYTSPLDRARETAALLGERLDLNPVLCEQAGEMRYGDFTGRDLAELDQDPEYQRFKAFRSGQRAPNGEAMVEVQARIVAALLRLRAQHEAEVVVVVSHRDVIKAALAYFLGMPLELLHRFELEPSSISTLELKAEGARVLGLNELEPR